MCIRDRLYAHVLSANHAHYLKILKLRYFIYCVVVTYGEVFYCLLYTSMPDKHYVVGMVGFGVPILRVSGGVQVVLCQLRLRHVAVSYTHLDVYKRQPLRGRNILVCKQIELWVVQVTV